MTEAYTYGQDAFQPLEHLRIAGQTFNPSQDHVLHYVDVQVKLHGYFSIPRLSIHYADGDHQPFGPLLSQDQRLTNLPTVFLGQHRLRFAMIPVLLNANTEYILSMTSFPPLPDSPCEWAYDSTSALYLRGHRILSNDSGTTWSHYYDQDHIFTEFGDPPAPPPPPDAPISNFALYSFTVTPYLNGTLIVLQTTVPCHLRCFHTKEPPRQYMKSRITRGLSVPWHVYYSFSSFLITDQQESGDTLHHTFYIEPWPTCQTRWFTFRGYVDNVLSPSVGPIFEYHNPGTGPFQNLDFENYPDFIDVPPFWTPFTLGPGTSFWLRDDLYVHQGYHSARTVAIGRRISSVLIQEVPADYYRGKWLRFTYHFWNASPGNYQIRTRQEGEGHWENWYNPLPTYGWHTHMFTQYINPLASTLSIRLIVISWNYELADTSWDYCTIEEFFPP